MSSRIKRFERRIARSKEKIIKLVQRWGILTPFQFQLVDPQMNEVVFPCNLGILFCGAFLRKYFNKIASRIELVFESFFFNIIDLGRYRFSKKMMSKGIKKEKYEGASVQILEKVRLHPTNKFYQVLIDKRIENNLDMIMALTNLPIYSSSSKDINFLFGEANLDHKTCVISSLTLKEQFYKRKRNRGLYNLRIQKEVLHEIGHLVLGLDHCENRLCVMKFCQTVEEIDFKYTGLCIKCQKKLEKLRNIYNF
ncbi:MAG: hypothetical protein JW891_02400 [Candidatus Lokiarchaeota archaeon]|nr:hypothetical protein [Candidatus Lokiarchaeota archaeon]